MLPVMVISVGCLEECDILAPIEEAVCDHVEKAAGVHVIQAVSVRIADCMCVRSTLLS